MAQVEIVVGARLDVVALAQERGDFVFGLIHHARRRRRAHDVVEPRVALDLFHHRRIRHEERVVLILAGRRLALHRQDANHLARLIFHANRRADRIRVAEQLIDDRLAEDAHVGGTLDVLLGEHAAAHDIPALDGEIRRRDAADGRVPVLIPVYELHADVVVGRDVRGERHVILDRLKIAERQRPGAVRAGAHAGAVHAARLDPDHVGADVRDRLLDARRCAFADRYGADDRADADDDAKRGQRAAHRVLCDGFCRDARDEQQVHGAKRERL